MPTSRGTIAHLNSKWLLDPRWVLHRAIGASMQSKLKIVVLLASPSKVPATAAAPAFAAAAAYALCVEKPRLHLCRETSIALVSLR